VVAALESVDGVFVFPEPDARHFLEAVRPDIYAKGGDYTLDTINQDERRLLEKPGGPDRHSPRRARPIHQRDAGPVEI
jgi:bifunctional ADP-heptose synthase (sugar kinase/adenylyltransferase)